MDSQTLRMTRILSTIPVNSIDSRTHKPCSMGSGCFVNYKGHLIFLTVLHAVKVKTGILHGIVVDYDSDKRSRYYRFCYEKIFNTNATL